MLYIYLKLFNSINGTLMLKVVVLWIYVFKKEIYVYRDFSHTEYLSEKKVRVKIRCSSKFKLVIKTFLNFIILYFLGIIMIRPYNDLAFIKH